MQQDPNQPGYNPYAPPTADDHLGVMGDMGSEILAGRGTRLGAAIIDGLLSLGAAIPGGILLAASDFENPLGYVLLGVGILALAIYQWYLIATTGQSLAKKWLGIKIVKVDGSPVNFVSGVVLRAWVTGALANIPYVGGLVGLVDALMIFGEERRCLHDHIAGTKVVAALIE